MDHETGEILSGFDPTRKWQLHAASRRFMPPSHRIQICMRNLRKDQEAVEVRQSNDSGRHYYAGLMACGSVWVCPVCAAKIQAVRSLEVRQAIDAWTAQGGAVVLMTQTVPHTRQDKLKELLGTFQRAVAAFKSGRRWVELKEELGIHGDIRGTEVTWGQANGWHPHAHTILFLQKPVDLEELHRLLFDQWRDVVQRKGLGEASPAAFKVQDASIVQNYVTKLGTEHQRNYQWNAEHELVKSHSKSGRYGSMTPFDFLGEALWGDPEKEGQWMRLFREFADAFFRRRQLVWSQGLKKELLGTDGLTDEQIAESIGKDDPLLVLITHAQWAIIRRHNWQGDVLRIADEEGYQGMRLFLDGLDARSPQRLGHRSP